MEKVTVNELFSGIGAQRKAFERLGIPHEVVGISDIDKYANQSYEAIFGKTYNYGDISKVERLNYADLWTYSFPCQDISVAGMQKGINVNTRSGLLHEVQRLLEVAKSEGALPKYLLLENVKNIVGKQFKPQFDDWLKYLDDLGYITFWQVLNARDYGIPQSRERVFAFSIRKDLNNSFVFPSPIPLKKCVDNLLELKVDEKYYIPEEKAAKLLEKLEASHHEPKILQIGRGNNKGGLKDIMPTITSSEFQHNNYLVEGHNKKVQNTIRCGGRGSLDRHTWDVVLDPQRRVRRLTALECWRFMGFDDSDFIKAKQSGVSDSQLYKQAGNSIVVDVLEKIFKKMFLEQEG